MHRVTRTCRRLPVARRGALTVEFAIVAPVVFLVVFAAVEFARLNMLVNTMENAAYEGARRGIIPGATISNVENEAEAILKAVGAINADVTVTPAVITNATPEVTVDITIPLNDNAWVTPRFTKDAVLHRSCTLTRETTSF
jgi:Flp pilus assembly protein TadG